MVMAGKLRRRAEKFKFHSKEFYPGLENLAVKGIAEQWDPTDAEEDKCKRGIPDSIEAN
jgi:hypothetical protein